MKSISIILVAFAALAQCLPPDEAQGAPLKERALLGLGQPCESSDVCSEGLSCVEYLMGTITVKQCLISS
ncbi:hypothetical protein H072_9417 [Dactylellina haptotyla CBS 200.50]|uniref:Dickkopf N-terminal cysteine-rich domain-containing protein n=1 Tax=Dactylellina haptotyla (strain CBS 200.50) TaxID=1284197 RepID=S8A2Q6_DACHA|nr:hypothetical protein H072_9417 [Dactylellina haptotyla CBS 200.50]